MSSEHFVKLDIGGTIFKTSKSTLTKFDGMLRTMLETGVPVKKDDAGCIFIDRDPKHFPKILNFMRDGRVELPDSVKELKEIQKEAQYYLLSGLVELCEAKIPQNTEETSNEMGTANQAIIRAPNNRHTVNHRGGVIRINEPGANLHVTNHRGGVIRINGPVANLRGDNQRGGSVRINGPVINLHDQSSESSAIITAPNERHIINHEGGTIRTNAPVTNLHVVNHRGGSIHINGPVVNLHMFDHEGGSIHINGPVFNRR